MSLARLGKRLRKSRQTSSDGTESSSSPSRIDLSSSNPSASHVTQQSQVEHSEVPTGKAILVEQLRDANQANPNSAPQPTRHNAAHAVKEPSVTSEALANLAPMSSRLDSGPRVGKAERKLDAIGTTINDVKSQVSPAVTFLKDLASTDLAQQIEHGIQRFAENIPWLMKSLDELARIHPAVTVAVLAFKAVYALESTRQENDRRVVALYVEMKDMMLVMVQLRGVESRTHIGLDGRALKDRLEELAEKTACDIKECANVCDTFLKKRLLVKVFKGPVWAERLAAFVQVFEDRKADFQFALAMHTANSLTDVKRQNFEIQAKLDAVLVLFQRLASPEERKIALEIEVNGGAAKVRKDDDILKSIMAMDVSAVADEKEQKGTKNAYAISARQKGLTLEQLKMELREDVDDSLARNFETFIGKFDLQVSLLQVALERYIHVENDRVIGAVTDVVTQGPHMKVKDPELRKIWQEMNWRGNVKARLFALTLQDHYRDEFELAAHEPGAIFTDEWALKYLGTDWLPSIIEAFDDDASGYVTITEVNRLMDLRPHSLGWSVPHWLAYLAIGWRMAASTYIARIKTILSRMHETLRTVLPANRNSLDSYLEVETWIIPRLHWVDMYLEDEDAVHRGRFQAYIDMEERRIRENLEKVRYVIDASDTLFLVAGAGNYDKVIWPLLFLLLEHDWVKVSAARKYPLDRVVFQQARDNIMQVLIALNERAIELQRRFIHRKLDLKAQFSDFACGLYTYVENHTFWNIRNKNRAFLEHVPDDELPYVEDSDIPEILKHGEWGVSTAPYKTVNEEREEETDAPEPLKSILGRWNGFAYTPQLYPTRSMLSLHFHRPHTEKQDDREDLDFIAEGIDFQGSGFTATGRVDVRPEQELPRVEWTARYAEGYDVCYFGRRVDEFTIMGSRGSGMYDIDWSFVLKKAPAEYMLYRPSPYVLGHTSPPPASLSSYSRPVSKGSGTREGSMMSSISDVDVGVAGAEANKAGTEDADGTGSDGDSEVRLDDTVDSGGSAVCADGQSTLNVHVGVPEAEQPGAARTKYRALWQYAISAVLHDVRRKWWTWSHFAARRDARKRFLDAHHLSMNRPFPHKSDDHHLVRTSQAKLACTATDARFYESLAVYLSNTRPSSDYGALPSAFLTPRAISSPPTRLICLECEPDPENFGEWVVLCDEPCCYGVALPDTGFSPYVGRHEPEHGLLKVRTAVHPLEWGSLWRRATDALQRVLRDSAPCEFPEPSSHTEEDSVGSVLSTVDDDGEPCKDLHASVDKRYPAQAVDGVAAESAPLGVTPVSCIVCAEEVFIGRCWYCLDCAGFVCNDCESKTLVACRHCKKPFPQPQWYYGNGFNDFICNMCWARGLKGPDPATVPPHYNPAFLYWRQLWHVYTHPLVRCLRRRTPVSRPPDLSPETPQEASMDRRLANMEERLAAMDTKFDGLQQRFDRLEEQLGERFERMQETLVERLAETLTNVLAGNRDV